MHIARLRIVHADRWSSLAQEEIAGIHPADSLILGLEGKPIPIAGIRQAQDFVSETPVGETRKVILCGLDTISLPAANALLKLLEEPPAYVEILLFAESEKVLPTIRSRVISSVESEQNEYVRAVRRLESEPIRAQNAQYLLPLLHNTVSKSVVLEGIFRTSN